MNFKANTAHGPRPGRRSQDIVAAGQSNALLRARARERERERRRAPLNLPNSSTESLRGWFRTSLLKPKYGLFNQGDNVKKYLSLACLALLVPATAFAETSAPTFSGPYVGIQGGWNQGHDKDVLSGPGRTGDKRSGFAVRGMLGYGHALGQHAIIGAEAGIATGGRDITTDNGVNRHVTDPGITLDAAARIGLKPTENIMLFGKAGWSFQRVKTEMITPAGTLRDKSSEHGILFGGGVELAVSSNVSLRAEFDRVSFDDHYKRNRALVGASLRF